MLCSLIHGQRELQWPRRRRRAAAYGSQDSRSRVCSRTRCRHRTPRTRTDPGPPSPPNQPHNTRKQPARSPLAAHLPGETVVVTPGREQRGCASTAPWSSWSWRAPRCSLSDVPGVQGHCLPATDNGLSPDLRGRGRARWRQGCRAWTQRSRMVGRHAHEVLLHPTERLHSPHGRPGAVPGHHVHPAVLA